jgi:hypothetical protein
VQLAILVERDVQPEHEIFDGRPAVSILDRGGLEDQKRIEQQFGPERRIQPQTVPPRTRGEFLPRSGSFNSALDRSMNRPGIKRKGNNSITAASRRNMKRG